MPKDRIGGHIDFVVTEGFTSLRLFQQTNFLRHRPGGPARRPLSSSWRTPRVTLPRLANG
jgi:hypothetical protein